MTKKHMTQTSFYNPFLISFIAGLFTLPLQLYADEARFFAKNPVKATVAQQELIALSIKALIDDCTVATKIKKDDVKKTSRGLEVTFTNSFNFNHPPAGNVTGINKVEIYLWDNAETSYGMDIYAHTDSDIYLLGKYKHLAYPIINMIIRPMPEN